MAPVWSNMFNKRFEQQLLDVRTASILFKLPDLIVPPLVMLGSKFGDTYGGFFLVFIVSRISQSPRSFWQVVDRWIGG